MGIGILTYIWDMGIPIPECDSCRENQAEFKVYTEVVGIRLCSKCKDQLADALKKKV